MIYKRIIFCLILLITISIFAQKDEEKSLDQIYRNSLQIEIINDSSFSIFLNYYKYNFKKCVECEEVINEKLWNSILIKPDNFINCLNDIEKKHFKGY